MGAHINADGLFQSDKYPTCPPGKVPLSVKDPTAQNLLWEYAQRRRAVDAEFSADLEAALIAAGYNPCRNEGPCAQCGFASGAAVHRPAQGSTDGKPWGHGFVPTQKP